MTWSRVSFRSVRGFCLAAWPALFLALPRTYTYDVVHAERAASSVLEVGRGERNPLLMSQNRRRSERLPVGFYVDQIIGDDLHRCFTTDLSALGIFVERVAEPLDRSTSVVQLEIPLPELGETLWAKGEVVYDRFDPLFHGMAIRFAGMARAHQRMLREWLWETRRTDQMLPVPTYRFGGVAVHRPDPARGLAPSAAFNLC